MMKRTVECVDRGLHKVCGKQCFVVVNVVVVAVNLCLGLVVNLGAFTTRDTSPPFATTLLLRDNLTMMGTEGVVPAALGLSDASGNFTSHAFVWAARAWVNVTGDADVCLATHSSADQLYSVAQHAISWSGPLSVAVFVSGKEYAVAASMVEYLRRCVEGVHHRVSFHLVHPLSRPPKPSTASPPLISCGGAPQEANSQLVAVLAGGEAPHPRYPQNLLRNLARRACHTPYSLNVDMDMLTPPHMSPMLSRFLHSRPVCGRCAYVVPVYELHDSVATPPADKMDLMRLLLRGRARRFHVKVYEKNQGNTHLEEWEVERPGYLPPPVAYDILYNITSYEEFWEPVLVLPRGAPAFDERFVGYGFTRSSQVYELHVRGFHFAVLDEPFLTHRGFQTRDDYRPARYAQIEINRIRYQMFKKELHARLGLPPPPPLSLPALRRTPRGIRLFYSEQRRRYVLKGLPDLLKRKGI